MLEPLFNFLASLGKFWLPFVVVDQWEQGVVLRFGKFKRVVDPGFHWIVPFAIDKVITTAVVVQTHRLSKQSITTKDQKSVVVSAVIKFTISDIKTFLLDVYQASDAIEDVAMGALRSLISNKTWDECQHTDLESELKKVVSSEIKRFGIRVEKVTLPDLAKMISIRLLQDKLNDEPSPSQSSS